MSKSPKHILVIRLSAMGDVAMIVPIIRQLIIQQPDIKVTVLTSVIFKPFFRDFENVVVYEADVKGKHKGLLGLHKLSRELKTFKIDAIADLHNVLRSNILKFFLNQKPFVQIDKGRKEKKELTSGKKFEQLKTTHQRYADVFEALGFKLDLTNPIFPPKVVLDQEVLHLLGGDAKMLIGIAPFATYKSKTYPLELMDKVISELSKSNTILLFGGGKGEIAALNKLEAKHKNVINLAGKLSLDQEMDVISNLDIMVSMDSGNAHLAAMLGVKVMTLWGVTHPYAGFYPFNQNKNNALLADRNQFPGIPTSIYGNKFPENYANAIATIRPEDILDKLKTMI